MAKRMPSLAVLDSMSLIDLQALWLRLYGEAAPALSIDLLRCGLAYRLQEKQQGKLDGRIANYLMRFDREDSAGKPKAVPGTKLSVGTKLVRDWHGVGHSVSVTDDGFEYDGKHWKSLTAIAREITGTKWSGPRFFGLNDRGVKA